MEERYSPDWWLWQMYRQVANFINRPSPENEQQLRALIEDYRGHRNARAPGNDTGHSARCG